jgi:serine/threonine-protein kinase
MAEVYLAHDDVLDRDVALKIMNPYYAGDEEFVERFKQEAKSAASLSHQGIVSIYDRGETEEGTYYIAMEYLPGGTLKDRILSRAPFSPTTAAAVATQIAAALQAAHHQGVVHRDIKPQNILVTDSGDVKVTDFGIARAAAVSSTMTRTGTVMGTAHYISPEQAMGEAVGPSSDLYSLGVILYEMVTGELPYEGDTTLGVAMKHVNTPLTPPKELNPAIPDGLNAVVVRLLAKYPGERYPGASELIRDLELVKEGLHPTEATTQVMERVSREERGFGPPIPSYPTSGKKKSRTKGLLLAFLLIALLALLGWGGYSFLPELQTQSQTLDVPEFTGMSLDQARQQAGEDFNINVADRVESEEPVDTVLKQDPEAGAQAEKGSDVSVVVSGRQVTEVPDVTGKSVLEARGILSGEDFEVKTRSQESSSSDEGKVMEQSPPGGEKAEVGSVVTLTVGGGPSTVEVPDLSGMTVSEAGSALDSAGLKLGDRSESVSDSIPEGGIISQNPSAGTGVAPGTSIDVTLSTGPRQVTVPDVVGKNITTAKRSMLNADLGYTTRKVRSQRPEGTVVSTSPGAGAKVAPGTSIALTESLGPSEPQPTPQPAPEETTGDDQNDKGGSDKKNDDGTRSGGEGGSRNSGNERGRGSGDGSNGGDGTSEQPESPDLPSGFPFD